MPWREMSIVNQREEFVRLAVADGANRSELCRRFGISRNKGYKWIARYRAEGLAGLADRSRRPHASPSSTPRPIEVEVLRIRAESNNAWGGRKIARVLSRDSDHVPAASTITEILRRNGKLTEASAEHPGPYQRFERDMPNDLCRWTSRAILRLAADAAIRSPFSTTTRVMRWGLKPAQTSRTRPRASA